MPIEFKCQSCNKTLRIPDTAAGKKVKCPNCQQVSQVPAAPAASTSPTPPRPTPPPGANPFGAKPRQGQPGLDKNPYAAPSRAASRAPTKPTVSGHGRLEATKAVASAWLLFKEHLGVLVGTFVVLMVANIGISFVQQIIQGVLLAAAGPNQGGNGANGLQVVAVVVIPLVFGLISQVVQVFLGIGLIRIQLCVARGQQVDFAMLFSGGRWLLKVFFASLLFGLILLLGFVALIVPGVYFALKYWSYMHFIVDKDCGIIESFKLAGKAAKNNLGETFLLGLIGFGLGILGMLMICIGLIFTTPIFNLSMTIAYLMMTSQRFRQAP